MWLEGTGGCEDAGEAQPRSHERQVYTQRWPVPKGQHGGRM